jgi:uncharacterized membrane protein (DUF485 family)
MKRLVAEHTRLKVGMAMYALAVVSAVLAVITAFSPTWLETTLGMSPDGGSGETEWGIVVAFAVAAVACAVAGRRVRATAHAAA